MVYLVNKVVYSAEKSEIDDLIRCDLNQLKTVSEDSWKYEIATVCMHCDEKECTSVSTH